MENQTMSFEFSLDPKDKASAEFMTRVHGVLAREFKRAAKEKKLSRADIARLLGVDRSVITRALNGKSNITIRTLSDLCWAMGVEPDFGCREELLAFGCNRERERFGSAEEVVQTWQTTPKSAELRNKRTVVVRPQLRREEYAS